MLRDALSLAEQGEQHLKSFTGAKCITDNIKERSNVLGAAKERRRKKKKVLRDRERPKYV